MSSAGRLRWALEIGSLEIRKQLSYRVDFWMNFVVSVGVDLILAYAIWRSIFAIRGLTEIGGFSFHQMMFYYLLTPMVSRVSHGAEMGFVSQEIYDGSLTRFLVYPISFLAYKLVQYVAQSLVFSIQLWGVLFCFAVFISYGDAAVSWQACVLGSVSMFLGGVLYFMMLAILEMVAFWADQVWSLTVMLRFAILFLGGGLVPLTLFPEWSRHWVEILPFSFLVSFPVNSFMGRIAGWDWLAGVGVLLSWTAIFFGMARWVWRRGLKGYTGVGI